MTEEGISIQLWSYLCPPPPPQIWSYVIVFIFIQCGFDLIQMTTLVLSPGKHLWCPWLGIRVQFYNHIKGGVWVEPYDVWPPQIWTHTIAPPSRQEIFEIGFDSNPTPRNALSFATMSNCPPTHTNSLLSNIQHNWTVELLANCTLITTVLCKSFYKLLLQPINPYYQFQNH